MRSFKKTERNVLVRALLLLLLADPLFGQAGPPMIGDDPGTPGDGKWEINTAALFERTRERKALDAPHLDLNYGLGDRIQLKYEVGWLFVEKEDSHNGPSDSLLGFKYRFMDQDKQGFAMSFYPQVELNTPPGVARQGLVESGTNLFLPIEWGKRFGKWEVAAEVGYEFVQHDKDDWQCGVVVGYPITAKLEALGELRGILDQDFHRNEIIVNLGARYALSEKLHLLLSAGRDLRDSDDSPTILAYVGLRFEL